MPVFHNRCEQQEQHRKAAYTPDHPFPVLLASLPDLLIKPAGKQYEKHRCTKPQKHFHGKGSPLPAAVNLQQRPAVTPDHPVALLLIKTLLYTIRLKCRFVTVSEAKTYLFFYGYICTYLFAIC